MGKTMQIHAEQKGNVMQIEAGRMTFEAAPDVISGQ